MDQEEREEFLEYMAHILVRIANGDSVPEDDKVFDEFRQWREDCGRMSWMFQKYQEINRNPEIPEDTEADFRMWRRDLARKKMGEWLDRRGAIRKQRVERCVSDFLDEPGDGANVIPFPGCAS